ncbi:unnamed protein product [Moneuplotes crassus]|uniref:Uncharacterized protein n=1 Tax=Euplotes crassus TaxID=5936 RepID=A0AAD1XV17_EUPCR|nr:unnamed protein product [Moneuplotes crassus]
MDKMLGLHGSNYLLVKSELGRSRPPTMFLPDETYSYGVANIYDKEAIKKLTSSWTSHINSKERLPEIDFIKLNKKGCRKIKNSRDLSEFKKQHELPRRNFKRGRKRDYLKYQADVTISYGKPVNYHNSMREIMSGEYGIEAENKRKSQYEIRSQQRSKSRYRRAIQMTKASSILAKFKKERAQNSEILDFKMKKYKDTKSKVRDVIDKQIKMMNKKKQKVITRNSLH